MNLFSNYVSTIFEKNEKSKSHSQKECQVITFLTLKGGVGKTTLACSLAKELSEKNKSIIMLDLDPQGNLSLFFNHLHETNHESIYNILFDGSQIKNAIKKTNFRNIHVIHANDELSLLNQLAQKKHINRFSQLIQFLKTTYDFIIIDCPPTSSVLHAMSVMNSNYVFSPMFLDTFSLQGIIKTIADVSDIELKYKINLAHKIIFNKVNSSDPLVVERANKIREIIPPNYWLASISDKGSEFNFETDSVSEFQDIIEFLESNHTAEQNLNVLPKKY